MENGERYEPCYSLPIWDEEATWALTPFVTDLFAPVYSFRSHMLPPQVLGALFSRASRVKGDLREILWKEYLLPILHPEEQIQENLILARELKELIDFYHKHPKPPYNTQRAYQFFAKWLAQYGDDSIAQMVSTNLVVAAMSQPALKYIEDQRVGLAPLEKSTRYVDYGAKINGQYMYFTDPSLEGWGLEHEYRNTMDMLFDTYVEYVPKLTEQLQKIYPDEKRAVLEKKSFDVLRGFLPMSTLSQVALHGNAQAFKYLIDRCTKHPLVELRWFAAAARKALDEEIPALLLRLDDDASKQYQDELINRKARLEEAADKEFSENDRESAFSEPQVRLTEFDPEGENKIISALVFEKADPRVSWSTIFNKVKTWDSEKKQHILDIHFQGRNARWQKVGRAFENAYVRFEIIMNAGAYRDLHRHRMHTQERERFTVQLGYEISPEIKEFHLENLLHEAIKKVDRLYEKINAKSKEISQYAPTMFHFMRFYQFQNMRQFFWEVELRTGSQGRPDYRWIEQEKYRLLKNVYPLLLSRVLVDMNRYELARRGTEEKIQQKEQDLLKKLT